MSEEACEFIRGSSQEGLTTRALGEPPVLLYSFVPLDIYSQTSQRLHVKEIISNCMGYSNAFCVLAENAGIRSVKVRGHVENGTYHMMNMVEVDGELFFLDVTVNDSCGRYTLFTMEEYVKATGFSPVIDDEAFALKYAD